MKTIKIDEILKLLDEGKTRKEINEILELNPREAKFVWSHEKLRNKKPAKYSINISLEE